MIGKILKKNKELIFLTIVGFVIVIWDEFLQCQQPIGLNFDAQSFIFWDYSRSLNLNPFKDFFYPYGLLFFLKIDSLFWYGISLIIVFISIGFIFRFFKSLFKDTLFTYTFFIFFCIFVSVFLDFDSFVRYSPLIVVSYSISLLMLKKRLLEKKYSLGLGILLGLLFSFVNDIFFYGIGVILIFLAFNFVFEKNKDYEKYLRFILYLLTGIIIGSAPLFFYLYNNNAIYGFIENYRLLKDLSIVAKVPFPPSLKYFENIFILGLIIVSSISLIEILRRKQVKGLSFYLKLSLVILIVLLEQKNILRPFYQQLIVFSFILFSLLLNDFKVILEKYKVKKNVIYSFVLSLLFILFFLILFEHGPQIGRYVSFYPGGKCVNNKISNIDKNEFKNYLEVKEYIQKDKNAKIFSFPGDPVFYVLLNQKVPYYTSIYEATPIYAQNKQIQYIKENNINYIILNTSSTAIQDGVPDKIRSRRLYEFIIANFSHVKNIGYFQILKKN